MSPETSTERMATGKAVKISEILRSAILRGDYKPGDMLPPQNELGKRHEVAEATAGAAVRKLAHEGLVVRKQGQGSYVVEKLPAANRILDFVTYRGCGGQQEGAVTSTWMLKFSRLGEQQNWITRWHVLTDQGRQAVENMVERLSQSQGVITYAAMPPSLPLLLRRQYVPIVAVCMTSGGLGDRADLFPQITYDRAETARVATEHLLALGYSEIGYVGGPKSICRSAAFLETMASRRFSLKTGTVIQFEWSAYDLHDLHIKVRRALEKLDRNNDLPQAFCCANVDIAHAVSAGARDLGKRIPQDLAIIACDRGQPDAPGQPGITTVSISRSEVCRKALEILEQVIVNPEPSGSLCWEPIYMPVHLTVKESCGAKLREGASAG